jgi:murein DD-endopeptidase MepM/ murein hydrolase activator NlpD
MPAEITSPYGYRTHPVYGDRRLHAGVDFRARQGTPVRPSGVGVVISTGQPSSSRTGLVTVQHAFGWRSRYLHLSRVDVRPGDVVTPSRPIGLSGGTPGTPGAGTSTGPHLHFELYYWDGSTWQSVDPMPYLRLEA